MPPKPAELVLKQLIKDFYELNLIPGLDGHYIVRSNASFTRYDHQLQKWIDFTMSETELLEYVNEPNWNKDSSHYEVESRRRDEFNELRAYKFIYQRNGWPDEYDGDKCKADFLDFLKKKGDIQRQIRELRVYPMSMDYLIPEELPLRKKLELFLVEAAGPLALRPFSS